MAHLNQYPLNQVQIGNTIRYTLKDLNDTVVYSGQVVAICDYESARAYADVHAIHQAMLAADNSLDDITTYRFLIVQDSDGVRRPVGYEIRSKKSWTTYDTVEIIDVGKTFVIKLFNANAEDATHAINALRELGLSCKITE